MRFLAGLLVLFLLNSCARVGRPSGGDKDTIPPQLISSQPPHATVNFKGKELILNFDEYVSINNPVKNILISPPLDNLPSIKPSGIASKKFKIIFNEELLPKTTYLINFGESIVDFNEGNKLNNLQLVFSTGPQIDSLKLKGKIQPVYFSKPPENIIVGLYDASTFNDSVVFKQKPYYVTNVDKSGQFEFQFLRGGHYKIIAIGDKNLDYKYRQGEESIAFSDKIIEIPKDSMVNLFLFKEYPSLKIENIEQKSNQHTLIEFKGHPDSLKVNFEIPSNKFIKVFEPDKLHLWYVTESDSIKLSIPISKNRQKKYYRKRITASDSLLLKFSTQGTLQSTDSLKISGSQPIESFDKDKIVLTKDSLPVLFSIRSLADNNLLMDFEKDFDKLYHLTVLPGSITSFSGYKNKDTLQVKFKIPKAEKYGKLIVNVKNKQPQQPVFIEIIKNGKVITKTPTQTDNQFQIESLLPGKYNIRIIFDDNKNNRWDTGNYLKHIKPERSFEPSQPVEIRANWDVNQTYQID